MGKPDTIRNEFNREAAPPDARITIAENGRDAVPPAPLDQCLEAVVCSFSPTFVVAGVLAVASTKN